MEILFATTNKRKLNDVRRILEPKGITVVGFNDLGIEDPKIAENAHSYIENARTKAHQVYNQYHKQYHIPVLGDDSGFEVEAFNGFPGLFSHRFGGNITASEANQLIIDTLGDSTWRNAKYVCSMVFYAGPRYLELSTTRESAPGIIAMEQRGTNGSGYDPIFIPNDQPDGQTKTLAEMEYDEADQYLHRTNALLEIWRQLKWEGWIV